MKPAAGYQRSVSTIGMKGTEGYEPNMGWRDKRRWSTLGLMEWQCLYGGGGGTRESLFTYFQRMFL